LAAGINVVIPLNVLPVGKNDTTRLADAFAKINAKVDPSARQITSEVFDVDPEPAPTLVADTIDVPVEL